MSLFVLTLAVCHAIPPILGGAVGKSKTAVYVGAALGAAIAIASGNPAYIVADLAGVAFGVWVGLSMTKGKPKESGE